MASAEIGLEIGRHVPFRLIESDSQTDTHPGRHDDEGGTMKVVFLDIDGVLLPFPSRFASVMQVE